MTATLDRLADDHTERNRATPNTDDGRFQAYAVPSRSGPHVTMQAGIVHAGRFWTTTSASSLKARSVQKHGTATAVVSDGDSQRIVSGPTAAIRPLRPWTLARDPLAPALSGVAVARLGLDQMEQLLGYFEASGSVPADWLPTRRVLLVTRIRRSLTLADGEVVDATGAWDRDVLPALGAEPSGGRPGALPVDQIPEGQRRVVHEGARAHLGVQTPTGPVAFPATFTGDDRFVVPVRLLAAVTADLNGRAAAVFDDSTSRRPDEKLGVMFRGGVRLVDVDGPDAVLAVETAKITTWDGFDADTVEVRR